MQLVGKDLRSGTGLVLLHLLTLLCTCLYNCMAITEYSLPEPSFLRNKWKPVAIALVGSLQLRVSCCMGNISFPCSITDKQPHFED